MKILLVEDDPRLADLLQTALKQQNHLADWISDGSLVRDYVETVSYDLLILDVNLPDANGIEVCRQLRSLGFSVPILLLTARDAQTDKVQGLDAGADDYVIKPFDLQELQARIRALLRRKGEVSTPVLEWGDLRLDPTSCEVTYAEEMLRLTPKEYGLLELFLHSPGRVFSISTLLEQVWSFEDAPGDRAVRMHIKGLRQKLKKAGAPEGVIETVYGIGYRLRGELTEEEEINPPEGGANPQASEVTALASPLTPETQKHEDAIQETHFLLSQAWQQHKDVTLAQVMRLSQTLASWPEIALSEQHQQQAEGDVHQLKGLLGSYGFSHASQFLHHLLFLLRTPGHRSIVNGCKIQKHLYWLELLLREDRDLLQDQTPALTLSAKPMRNAIAIIDPYPGRFQALWTELHAEGVQVYGSSPRQVDPGCLGVFHPQLLILTLQEEEKFVDNSLSALEFCQYIRQLFPTLPIVLIIPTPDRQVINNGLDCGVADFVIEPIQVEELTVRILRQLIVS